MTNLPEYVDEDEVKTMFGCADKVINKLGLFDKTQLSIPKIFQNYEKYNHKNSQPTNLSQTRRRETVRQRDRETERQRDRETERHRDRETEIEIEKKQNKKKKKPIEKHKNKKRQSQRANV